MEKVKALVLSMMVLLACASLVGPSIAAQQADLASGGSRKQRGDDTYLPGTEKLGEGEIGVISCGTGVPIARKWQAASSFVVELGNGDKFIFDIG